MSRATLTTVALTALLGSLQPECGLAKKYMPPRTGLAVDAKTAPAGLMEAIAYPCEDDESKTCHGIKHSEALFGIPKYGANVKAALYEVPTANDPAGSGCGGPITPDPNWVRPFILMVNRGECHFTEKVRNAARAGAVGVIVSDNQALRGEPLAYCDDFSQPHYLDSNTNKWIPCTSASHGTECKCGSDHATNAVPIPSAPSCGSAAKPEYQTTCGSDKIKGPCWFCKAIGSSSESWYPSDCFEVSPSDPKSRNCQLEQLVPFMADDGDGGDITIPSFIVSDYYGQLLKHAIAKQKSAGKRPLRVVMSWAIKQRKRADYELWSSCEDSNGAEFKRDFQETALKLIDVADFTPRYYIYDGHALQCDSTYECGNQCISDGRYCGPDPDDDLDKGVSGSDIVTENLRQMCIWKVLQESVDNGKDRKELMKWWCYVNDFANKCFNGEGAMESGETFARCGDNVMKAHALDQAAVDKCVKNSFLSQGGVNTLLHQEIVDRADYGVLKLPEAVVNGVVLRGQTSYGATLEMNVARAICNGFLDGPPAACEDIIHPDGSLGQEGKAVVKLGASLGFVSGGELVATGLTDTIISRFRSTLALKLGVEPQAITISSDTTEKSSTNKVMVVIEVKNLKCPTGQSKASSAKILDSLKGVATCESSASTDTAVEDETGVGTTYYFHTSTAHSSQSRQIRATVTSMSADETQCPEPSTGLAAIWVVLIVVVCCLVIFGAFFVFWRRRMESQMRDEVKAILQTYMPLDDAGDFSSAENDQARMLDGNPSSSMELEGRI